jgi:Ca2+-dependent lipid-binding protein
MVDLELLQQSRVGSRFEVEVLDWNQIEQSKSLGTGSIDLESIEPCQPTTRTVALSTPKSGTVGEVRIKLLFEPAIVARSPKNASALSTAGRAMTQVGGIPLGAGKGLVHGVGTAGKTMKGVFVRDRNSSKSSLEIPPNGYPRGSLDQSSPVAQPSRPPDLPSEASVGLPTSGVASASAFNGESRFPDDYGMLKVAVLGAKDLVGAAVGDPVKAYVVVKVGEKEQKTKHTAKTTTPEW